MERMCAHPVVGLQYHMHLPVHRLLHFSMGSPPSVPLMCRLLDGEVSEHEFQPSPFFAEQLCAFELWLDAGSQRRRPPEQLPIVLQASVDMRRAVTLQFWVSKSCQGPCLIPSSAFCRCC